jgi:transposase InsO family protein
MGRRRVRRLMRKLGLWAVRPKRNTSKRHPGHKVYPYLLRGKTIDRANQVWAADITYIQMRQGFLYLVAIIDWATRRVLSWRLSNTLTAGFCVEALSEALARFGKPGIFNTDQGAQFTSDEFTKMLTCWLTASMPSMNFTPVISFGNWLWPSRRRQLFSAACASLKTMAIAVLFERHPLERMVRCRTVANVLSMGLVVRRCFQCSAGKS